MSKHESTTQTTPPGWEWNGFRKCWERGADKIYAVEEGFVIASGDVWLPGSFATFENAEEAINDA